MTEPCRPLVDRLLTQGYIANCTQQTVLRLLPPLVIRKEQTDRFVGVLRRLLEDSAVARAES
jgi:acetylornithine/succinyldiaminopimelate/putrescine aminotransferase